MDKKVMPVRKVTPVKKVTPAKKVTLVKKVTPAQKVKTVAANAQSFYLDRSLSLYRALQSERGDVPGWVLVVLMTTGLVTGIWTLAAPRIDSILRNSLDSMNGIR